MEENKVVMDVAPEATTEEPKYINIVVENGDKKFIFILPDGSKIGEAYDAAFQVLQKIHDLGREAMEKAKPVNSEEDSENCEAEACTE